MLMSATAAGLLLIDLIAPMGPQQIPEPIEQNPQTAKHEG